MVSESDWKGLVSTRKEPTEIPDARMIIKDSPVGGSGAFLVLASDDRRWWLKPLNNAQGSRVTINEFIVGKVAALIEAPACEVCVVRIPEILNGPRTRTPVTPGVSCASLDVGGVQQMSTLSMRERNRNMLRHVGVLALYDWCFGSDHQWLYAGDQDMQIYSHDHGFYLTGRDWNQNTLRTAVGREARPPFDPGDFDSTEIDRLSARLESVERQEIAGILNEVPVGWPVADTDLETLGWFLEERSRPTADRLRALR